MLDGPLLTAWTIWGSLVCYWIVVARELLVLRGDRQAQISRWIWSVGCLLFFAHVACAFHFVHDWSHMDAFADTAQVTDELIGWSFGGGLYFNYLFAVVWLSDAAWWWISGKSYLARPRGVSVGVHGFMFFMAVNGAVVFVTGPVRWVGAAVSLVLMGLALRRVLRKTCPTQN